MKLLLLLLLTEAAVAQPFYKATWDVTANTNVAGYRVLMGKASGVYIATNSVAGRLNNTVTLSNAPPGVGYIVAVAYASDGTESMWSTPEVKWTNRAFAPKKLMLSSTIQSGLSPAGPWTNLAQFNFTVPMPAPQQFFRTQTWLEELP